MCRKAKMADTVNNTDIKDYLSVIYGDNIKVLFNTYVFTWDSDDKIRSGYILATNGAKLITEKIEDAIEIKSRVTGEIQGYAIFLNKQLTGLFRMCNNKSLRANTIKDNILIISKELTFERGKIQSRFYSTKRPDLVLTYRYKRYLGKFNDDGELLCFVSPS